MKISHALRLFVILSLLPFALSSQTMFMQRLKLTNGDSISTNIAEARVVYELSNGNAQVISGYPNTVLATLTDFDWVVANSCGNIVEVTANQSGTNKRMGINPQFVYRIFRESGQTRIQMREGNQIFVTPGSYDATVSLFDNCLAGNALNGGDGVTIIGDSIFVSDTDSLNELQYLDTTTLVGYDLLLSLYKDSLPASIVDLSPLIDSAQVIADSVHTLYSANDTVPHGRVATLAGNVTFDGSGLVAGDRQFTAQMGSASNGGQSRVLARRGTASVVRAELAYETDSALTQVRVFRNGVLLATLATDTFSRIDISGPLALTAIESYPALLVAGSPYDDYGPPLSGHTNVVQLTSDAEGVEVTGWKYGMQGRIVIVHNVGLYPITFKDDDAGSSAGNKFDFGADYVLEDNGAMMMQYIGTNWRIVGTFSGSASEDLNGIYTGSGTVGQGTASVMATVDSTYEFGIGRLSSFPSASSSYHGDYGMHINGDGGFGLQGKRVEILGGYYDRTRSVKYIFSGDGLSGTVSQRIGLTALSNILTAGESSAGFSRSVLHAYGKFDEIEIGTLKVTPGAGAPGSFRDFAYMYHGYGRAGTDTIPLSMFLGFPQGTDTTSSLEKSYARFRGWAVQSHVQTGALTGSRAFNHIMVNAGTGLADTSNNTVGFYKSLVGGGGYYLPNGVPGVDCDSCLFMVTGTGPSDAETFLIDKDDLFNNENIYNRDDLLKAGGTTVGLDSGSLKLTIPNAGAIRYGLQVIGNTANSANRFFVAKTEADSFWVQESAVGYTMAAFLRNLRIQTSEIAEMLADSIDIIEGTVQTKDSVHFLLGMTENGIVKRLEGNADNDIVVWNGETWAAEAISGFITAAVSIPSTEVAFGTGTGITSSSALKYVSPALTNQVSAAEMNVNDTGASSTTSGGLFTLANYDNAALSSGHRAGIVRFAGNTNGSGGTAYGGSIEVFARSNWNGTSSPGRMSFKTTNAGSTTPHEKFALTSSALGTNFRAELLDRTTLDLYNTGNTTFGRIEVTDTALYILPPDGGIGISETGITGKIGFTSGAVTITADENDLYMGNTGDAVLIEMVATGATRTLTGIAPVNSTGTSRLICIYNSGAEDIVFSNQDVLSIQANRFNIGSDFTLEPEKACWLFHLSNTDGWVMPSRADVGAGVTAHGSLTGLSNDDHAQYLLLAGRGGGQTAVGGTASGDDLTLNSTSNATKGDVFVQSAGGNMTVGGGATASEIKILEPSGSGSNYTSIKVAPQTGDITYTLPIAVPTADGQSLVSTTAGAMSWAAFTATPGTIRPAQITATTNDYSPTGYSTTLPQYMEVTGDGSFRTITGLAAATRDGVTKTFANTGANCYILAKSHTGSSAANRFRFSKDVVMLPNMEATIRYDSVNAYWRLVSVNKEFVDFGNLARLDFRENGGSVTSGDSDMWNWTANGGTITNSAPAGATTNIRGATLSSSVATAFPNMSAKQTMIWLSANNSYIRCAFRIATPSALSVAADDYDLRLGFKGTVDTNYTEGAYISYERQENSGGWTIKTHDGSSPTTTNAGSPIAASTYYSLELIYYPYGEIVVFVDGVRYATTSTLPTDLAVVPFVVLDSDRRTSATWTMRITDFNCDFVNVN